jgi:hypothetical protein
MIEILEGFPGNVIAATVKGRLTRSDYADVLIPKAGQYSAAAPGHSVITKSDRSLRASTRIAMWEDFKVGARYRSRWERVAVVSRMEAARRGGSLSISIPGEIKGFATSRSTDAPDWITAG